jgi:hypothetical protein
MAERFEAYAFLRDDMQLDDARPLLFDAANRANARFAGEPSFSVEYRWGQKVALMRVMAELF